MPSAPAKMPRAIDAYGRCICTIDAYIGPAEPRVHAGVRDREGRPGVERVSAAAYPGARDVCPGGDELGAARCVAGLAVVGGHPADHPDPALLRT